MFTYILSITEIHGVYMHPRHVATYVGSNLEIICNDLSNTHWIKDGENITRALVEYTDAKFTMYNLNENDSGIYTCNGTTASNEHASENSEVLVGGKITLFIFVVVFFLRKTVN